MGDIKAIQNLKNRGHEKKIKTPKNQITVHREQDAHKDCHPRYCSRRYHS